MSKRVNIGAKPGTKTVSSETADNWVKSRDIADKESMKRLTIDIPESLHRKIKLACAGRGTTIADEVRELLVQKYDQAS